MFGSINSIDPHLKVPVVYNYNLTAERQLPWGLLLRLAYTGNLLRQPDINFPSFPDMAANYVLSPRPPSWPGGRVRTMGGQRRDAHNIQAGIKLNF